MRKRLFYKDNPSLITRIRGQFMRANFKDVKILVFRNGRILGQGIKPFIIQICSPTTHPCGKKDGFNIKRLRAFPCLIDIHSLKIVGNAELMESDDLVDRYLEGDNGYVKDHILSFSAYVNDFNIWFFLSEKERDEVFDEIRELSITKQLPSCFKA